MIKLKRLKINRYRNVEPCDLRFGDRFNVLLGPNGAGKTTLLNLISKVLRTNLADTSDPFSIEIELLFPGGTLSGKIESFEDTKSEEDELPVELRAERVALAGATQSVRAPQFELRVTFVARNETNTITRTNDKVIVVSDRPLQSKDWSTSLFEIPSFGLLSQALRLTHYTRTTDNRPIDGDVQNTSRFDESLDTFRAITARQDDWTIVSTEQRPRVQCQNYLDDADPLTVRRVVFPIEGIVPASFLDLIESRFSDGMTDMSFNQDDVQFLSQSCFLLGLRAATGKFDLVEKHVRAQPFNNSYVFGNLKFWFTRKDGSIFQDQHLSYGQKRLLTFLYYLEANPSIIIADELVNGLHHAWIKECMEAIGERQAFLTSQNPLLLDYLFFTSVEEVKESFILCRTEPVGNSEKMIWRNLTDDEAAMFYSAYKVGIEHVGEILRTRGLW